MAQLRKEGEALQAKLRKSLHAAEPSVRVGERALERALAQGLEEGGSWSHHADGPNRTKKLAISQAQSLHSNNTRTRRRERPAPRWRTERMGRQSLGG